MVLAKEACGIFGVFGHPEAAKLAYFGLYALQHRGQESAGIVVSDGKEVREYKGLGLVPEIFDERILETLGGHMAIGHVRYSTTGSPLLKNIQPFTVYHLGLTTAIAHNGNLINAYELRINLEKEGSIFQSSMDSEVIIHLLAKSLKKGLEEALAEALSQVKGSYSLVIMTEDQLIGARDPHGFRPMCLGELNGAYILASETCALDLIGAHYIRDIEPGEIMFIDKNGLRSIRPFSQVRPSFCIFEFIYFARPDSNIFGTNVYMVRKRQGEILAQEYNIDADLVMPFPDSGTYAALGYSKASGIPFEMGVIRNHYVGRTFIQPSQSIRDFGVKVKLNPVRCLLKDKRIIIIEDSIIRGTTCRNRIRTMREAGAKQVHILVSCPPHRFPCYYGIDFTGGELIAYKHSVEEIGQFIGVDDLHYLTLEGLLKATNLGKDNFCLACFTGDYPVKAEGDVSKYCFERIG